MTRTVLACVLLVGCARGAPAPAPEKIRAPLTLALTADAPHGRVTARLEVRATGEVPEATARFVVPEGVTLLEGALETPLGRLGEGEARIVTVVLDVPAEGAQVLAAGVDVAMRRGVVLHESATVPLGAAVEAAGARTVEDPSGERIRMERVE